MRGEPPDPYPHQYFTYGNKLFFHLFQQAGMALPKTFVHSSRFSK